MSTKLLVNVLLPATGKSYDVWVPRELMVFECAQLIGRLLSEAEGRFYRAGPDTALYLRQTGDELRAEVYMGNLGFCNGTKLILI
ncbi:MAG: hypothetical protein LBP24_04220 [Coriobacteriales bacterium]|jgi:hypothetical protein|nr:hypothetical protein [Coriobacteriales bacterium]